MACFFNHVFLAIFLVCTSALLPLAKSALVDQECTTVSQQYTSLSVSRCIDMLSVDSGASKATNIKDLTIIGLRLGAKSSKKIVSKINKILSSGKLNPDAKPVVAQVAGELKAVHNQFAGGLLEVKEGEYMDANYGVMIISDYITRCQELLRPVEGKVDMEFFQRSFDLISAWAEINIVITNDGPTEDGQ